MRRALLAVAMAAASTTVFSAPFVVSDPLDARATHCGILMDAIPKQAIPVVADVGGNICKFDLAGLANGSHTVRATAIAVDPIWGSQESVESLPLSFVKPVPPSVPAGLGLKP